MNKDRKQDTHEKIQLGGLVVKAGLRNADKAIILGALCELFSLLDTKSESKILKKYFEIGSDKFKE
ncbi:MAG: conjugal transfer protein TraD [Methylococcaceae bacterium]|nr:conjugal transfer protein TraD [Methylococcaceae bacterium]